MPNDWLLRCTLLVTLSTNATSYGKVKYCINSKFAGCRTVLTEKSSRASACACVCIIQTPVCHPLIYCVYGSAGDKIEKNEMGGACGTYGGRERCAQGFGGET